MDDEDIGSRNPDKTVDVDLASTKLRACKMIIAACSPEYCVLTNPSYALEMTTKC
jgi:hypothetical protein